jgi:hypothetical protein
MDANFDFWRQQDPQKKRRPVKEAAAGTHRYGTDDTKFTTKSSIQYSIQVSVRMF